MLKRNHRTLGRVVQEQGEFTILQTGERVFTAARTNELLPAGEKEAEFELRMLLADVVERARLYDVPMERLESLLREEVL